MSLTVDVVVNVALTVTLIVKNYKCGRYKNKNIEDVQIDDNSNDDDDERIISRHFSFFLLFPLSETLCFFEGEIKISKFSFFSWCCC